MSQSTNGPTEADLRAAVARQGGARYFAIGIFVLLGLISFIAVLFLLTDPAMFRNRYFLVTTLTDAGGVRAGDPVQMRGVNIGRVSRFQMTTDGRVDIRLELKEPWQVPEGSTVTLTESGVFGGRTVEILPTLSQVYLQPWDTIPGEDSGGGLLQSAGDLASQAEVVLARLGEALSDETIGSVQGATREVEGLAIDLRQVVAAQKDEIEALTASLSRTAAGFEELGDAAPDVASAAARADSLMAELTETSGRLDAVLSSLDTVLGRMARGEGTLGMLSRDDALYLNLASAAASFDSLVVDLKANPKRYLTVEIF